MSLVMRCCAAVLLLTVTGGGGSQARLHGEATRLELPPPQERWHNQLPRFTASQEHGKHMLRSTKLKVTTVKNCGTDHDPIQLNTLTLPRVIDLQSSFNFSIDVVLHQTLKAPLKVSLKVHRYLVLWWVTVPCLEGAFGSCSFSDICSLLPGHGNSTCPPVFIQHNLPCGCPAERGEYKAEDVPVDLRSAGVPEELVSGSYRLRATINNGTSGLQLGCFDLAFKLE